MNLHQDESSLTLYINVQHCRVLHSVPSSHLTVVAVGVISCDLTDVQHLSSVCRTGACALVPSEAGLWTGRRAAAGQT